MSARTVLGAALAVVAAIGIGATLATPALAAPASTSATQSQIDGVLAAHPGGTQISPNQVAWRGGSVVLTIPGPSATGNPATPAAAVHQCPSGWYCFYEDQNWGGRRLQFQDCTIFGTTQALTDYGFGNQTSSWEVNRSVSHIDVVDVDGSSYTILWVEHSNTGSSFVGGGNNDRADLFTCYS